MARATRKPRHRDHIMTAIQAAKFSIENFNRIDVLHKDQAALIFNAQAWELLAKGSLIRYEGIESILQKSGKTITAERAVNKMYHSLKLINKDEAAVVQQIISLRNEAMHGILPVIPDEIMTHLLYFSIKSFRKVLEENFKTYFKEAFNTNFLSIAFTNHTFYSDKVSKLFSDSRKYASEKNRLLYLLDRGVAFSEKEVAASLETHNKWQDRIKKLPRKSRVARHLSIYTHMTETEDVRFVPVEVKKGFRPEVRTVKSKNSTAPVMVHKSDPNIDYPHTTKELAEKIGKNQNFTARMASDLFIRTDEKYCYLVKTSKSGVVPKYGDNAIQYMKSYLEKHPEYNPYNKS